MIDPAGFPVEADRLAAQLGVQVDREGLVQVQAAMARPTDALIVAAGCFAGEVIRRAVGGTWTADGLLVGVGAVAETAPLAKARAREDLVTYVRRVIDWA
jgi:hypothetical protein